MRVDGVAFESPTGFEDSSSYSYQARAGYEELSIEFELPIGRATPAQEVIIDVREGLAGYFGAEFVVVAQGDQVFIGQPGKFLQYRLDGSEQVVSKIIVANTVRANGQQAQRGDWIKLVWSAWPGALAAGGSVDAIVDPIAASLIPVGVPVGRVPAPPVLPGHVRHQAGDWQLDVPAHLLGPRTFIYEDIEAELRVELSVLEAGAPEPTLEPGVAVADAEQINRTDQTLADGERIDWEVRSDSDPNGESTLILAKRNIELVGARAGERRFVVVSATGPARDGPRLRGIVDDLLASVRGEQEPV
jgi:hypothetical protein